MIRRIWLSLAVGLIAAGLLVACQPQDKFEHACDAKGGIVQQQTDRQGHVKGRVCKRDGKILRDPAPVSMPAPAPGPGWR